jgi:DNA repair protein RadA/Sms
MAKAKVKYVCGNCGYTSTRWLGNCPSCKEWNCFNEEIEQPAAAKTDHRAKLDAGHKVNSRPLHLNEISAEEGLRFHSGSPELDRVLGGGFLPGSFVLLGGSPGVGKSTLMLQVAAQITGRDLLYCSGEESAAQIRQRASRLGLSNNRLRVFAETDMSLILQQIEIKKPDMLIIDSIQTVFRPEIQSMPGSVNQIRECATLLMQLAKQSGITVLTIGHVTKDGDLAGPRLLEHMVDTVLQFEGDEGMHYRLLRGLKNRFGATNEIGVFEMTEKGLADVGNPSSLFLSEYDPHTSGNAIVCSVEGSRPFMIEVQALVTPTNYGTPQRTAHGFDQRRLALLLAVLEKRCGFRFSTQDVFLNVAGGLRLTETACDLGVVAALVSGYTDKPLRQGMVLVGEVGLGGEVRAVMNIGRRIGEAKKMGYHQIVIPRSNETEKNDKSIQISRIRTLQDMLAIVLD